MSAFTGGSVDQIYLPALTPSTAYRLDIHAGDIADPLIGEEYALAVSYSTVPEPGITGLILTGLWALNLRCVRRMSRHVAAGEGEAV